jgi:2-polyprenyl-3-methyl-5-hydroxy-6-metoxy-1,4-benzoquinol methylase
MKCRLCGNDKLKLYYTQGNNEEFLFYKCGVCKLVNYDLNGGLDQAKYGYSYINPYDENSKMNIMQTKTYQFIKSNLKINGKIIDIGCGNGRLLYLFKNDGWDVKGLELSPLKAQSIKDILNIEVEVVDFLDYNYKNEEKYDVVVLRHVLEHLPNPLLAMSKINSILKIDSYAVLEFPNIEGLDLKIKRLTQRYKIYRRKYSENYKPGHCNEYSRQSFQYLALKTGFEIIAWETYSHKPVSDFIYNRIPIGNKARTIIKKIGDI